MNPLTNVEICNLALTLLGSSPIISLDQDTKESRVIARFYDSARRAVLAEAEWSFAVKFKKMETHEGENITVYGRKYIYPVDAIKPIELYGHPDHPFMIAGRFLYTDVNGAILTYISNETNELHFSDGFTRALAFRLATDLAVYLKAENSAEMIQKYEYELTKAKGQDVRYKENRKIKSKDIASVRFRGM